MHPPAPARGWLAARAHHPLVRQLASGGGTCKSWGPLGGGGQDRVRAGGACVGVTTGFLSSSLSIISSATLPPSPFLPPFPPLVTLLLSLAPLSWFPSSSSSPLLHFPGFPPPPSLLPFLSSPSLSPFFPLPSLAPSPFLASIRSQFPSSPSPPSSPFSFSHFPQYLSSPPYPSPFLSRSHCPIGLGLWLAFASLV